MYSLSEVARVHTGLDEADIDHLQRLVASWGLMADLSFTDLVLFAACVGQPNPDPAARAYVVLAQVRPTTSQTIYPQDLVGSVVTGAHTAPVDRCLRSGEPMGPTEVVREDDLLTSTLAVPVRRHGRVIGVLASEGLPAGGRRNGELESAYLEVFGRLARMVSVGEFPFPGAEDPLKELPRVGDGIIVLDAQSRIRYSSPNAVSALHRLGVMIQVEGATLAQLGLADSVVRTSVGQVRPATAELSRGNHTHVLVQAVPLLERLSPDRRRVTGVLLVLRDISDLRRLDRLLVSKDTHIREIHHRVKNNLQTISSLLRIQARRLTVPEAREAIEESVRRIASIAVVHETLSREAGDDVPFPDIARPIIRMVEESLVSPERPVHFQLVGDAPILPADVATPLALVLTELLQNTVDHAYRGGRDPGTVPAGGQHPEPGTVVVTVTGSLPRPGSGSGPGAGSGSDLGEDPESDRATVRIDVLDDGVGLPEGFSLDSTTGLGLSIVRTLVEHELEGSITLANRTDGHRGTLVSVITPLRRSDR
ncbi:MAG: sensor histidine kinase [Acidimicrobiales bacterium]